MQYSYLCTKGYEDHHQPFQEHISRILSYQALGANMKHFESDSSYKQRKRQVLVPEGGESCLWKSSVVCRKNPEKLLI